jgi:hypothetical protein
MNDSSRRKVILWLLVANVVTSILHYVDNVLNFDHYPEPTWLNPHLIDMAWFVMTPFGVVGYLLLVRGYRLSAFACLLLYSMMNLLVLGHYPIAPPWKVSFKINLFILAEAATAMLLAVFISGMLIRRSTAATR